MGYVISDHWRIAAAGWSYRTDNRGWIIYRDPQTGLWCTRAEAIEVIQVSSSSHPVG
jgi:hypothetical protein